MAVRHISETPSMAPPADLKKEPVYQVLYMGIPYAEAKLYRNIWYHETADGYKPFALQGRVRRVTDPQRGTS
jgi:hypothetical protein